MKKRNLVTAVVIAAAVCAAIGVFTTCQLEVAEEEKLKPVLTPYISVPPASAAYTTADTPAALAAQVWNWDAKNGDLSFQWYSIDSLAAYIAGGKGAPIETAGGSGDIDTEAATDSGGIMVSKIELPLDTLITGTGKDPGKKYYYYLEITNTDNSATGEKTQTVNSEIATITFSAVGAAKFPVISRQPFSSKYQFGRNLVVAELSVRASSPDTGALTYQWYYNYTGSAEADDLESIPGATSASYQPTINLLKPGLNYFFVEITNTVGGGAPAIELSLPAVIDMEPGQTALEPVITVQPQDELYFLGDAERPLSGLELTVQAEELIDGGTLRYQWYSNTRPEARRGAAIGGATETSFKPTDTSVGTYYYYVDVINDNESVQSRVKQTITPSRAVRVVIAPEGAEVPTANATVTVADPRYPSNRYQYVRGYGGMDVAWANFPEQKPEDMELMYNPDWGLGYNINRIMISPANTNVNIAIRDLINSHRPYYYENVKIVNKYGGYNLASPWSPPKEWKSNNSINGGGHLVYAYRQQFADYLRTFARHMYDAGAPIYAISISNEPNYTAGYDGCEWTPEEMRDFYKIVNPKPFTTGIRGYGGGRELSRVLTVNGESANTPYINEAALLDSESRANIDLFARHVYGETGKNLWSRSPTGSDITVPVITSNIPNILDRNDGVTEGTNIVSFGTKFEVWMTEHNINSANPTAYPNDSTWNYVWRFMNDVDLVMRLSNENAFVWWASKRFYSMVGDGQFGTRDGAVLPRGIGLSHYAKYTIDTHRLVVTVTGQDANKTNIPHTERPNSLANNTTFNLDNNAVRITAYASIASGKDNQPITNFRIGEGASEISLPDAGIEYISLVMWTPTSTNGGGGRNMGTIEIKMPSGFTIGGVSAHKSVSASNMFAPEAVTVHPTRTSAFVTLGAGEILSVKLTRLAE